MHDKPYKTLEERIDILKNRNLIINDIDFGIQALRTMGYYDLINGYKPFFAPDDNFKNRLNIEFLFFFRLYDISLQNIFIKYSLFIEAIFKNELAEVLSSEVGVCSSEYLSKSIFIENTAYNQHIDSRVDKCLANFTSLLNHENLHRIDNPTNFYLKTKKDVPPWILFKNSTFSNTIDLYGNLKGRYKDKVAEHLILTDKIDLVTKKDILKRALNFIRISRNKIVHNLSFLSSLDIKPNYDFSKIHYDILSLLLPEEFITKDELKNNIFGHTYFLMNAIFLLLNSELLKQQLISDISTLIITDQTETIHSNLSVNKIYAQFVHLPENLLERFQAYNSNNINRLNPIRNNMEFSSYI